MKIWYGILAIPAVYVCKKGEDLVMLKRNSNKLNQPLNSGKIEQACERRKSSNDLGIARDKVRSGTKGGATTFGAKIRRAFADKTRKVEIVRIPIGEISVPLDHRACNMEKVRIIAESIKELELETPITVRSAQSMTEVARGSRWVLVAGRHRIEATRLLGHEFIDAFIFEGSKADARAWTNSENLHRGDLTVLEEAEHIVEWGQRMAAQGAQSGQPHQRQPHDTGVSSGARGLGFSRQRIQRARKIAAIDPAAKEAAIEGNLDDRQSALLAIAAEATRNAQLAKVRELAGRRNRKESQAAAGGGDPAKAEGARSSRTANRSTTPAAVG
jgi:ParB-like chromosome segregation protein Spo0J